MNSPGDSADAEGFPIRISSDQSLFATPRSFSQRTTSFIASRCQGIHQMLLSYLISQIVMRREQDGGNRLFLRSNLHLNYLRFELFTLDTVLPMCVQPAASAIRPESLKAKSTLPDAQVRIKKTSSRFSRTHRQKTQFPRRRHLTGGRLGNSNLAIRILRFGT